MFNQLETINKPRDNTIIDIDKALMNRTKSLPTYIGQSLRVRRQPISNAKS